MWPEMQAAYADALLDPVKPVPFGARFAVHRNNVTKGLADALADAFPVTAALVGAEFFAAMAREFVRAAPPASPVLIEYGGDFAGFIETFAPARELPYLADLARLERARTAAYHAADAEPLAISALAALPEDALGGMRLRLHPSLRLVRSAFPIVAIWQAHQTDDTAAALAALTDAGECALVVRPRLTVEVRRVTAPVFDFVSALHDGATLGAALVALAESPSVDPSNALAELFEIGAVRAINPVQRSPKGEPT